ncbi:class I SAM-dependent rRNA methyltransferase [Usitatibacter palustris]|uniref:class I SAM-dependent rRNA methyltransferase n=1 Tax=Usitatibacter palustris TaxID=2732487 RepID=UPI001FE34E91|nr:class I SAM-dependent rRNA methyltransferase [Usitatibacter palustris]
MTLPKIVLKPGREKSLRHLHPWVFSGAIERVDGHPDSGDTVEIVARDGAFLARGAYSPQSQISARAWTFDPAQQIDEAFLGQRLKEAIERRSRLFDANHDSGRLVHSESDGLPGLIVDRYGDALVIQILSAGAERWRKLWPAALQELTQAKVIHERSDAEVRELEGLPVRNGTLVGTLKGLVPIIEGGLRYEVDVVTGQKTGFFLDQRDNRALAATYARDAQVLNAFSYTGGFTVAALKGGAKHVLSIDTSTDALALGQRHVAANALDATRAEWSSADVFAHFRKLRDQGKYFDLVILDPPKFAPTEKHVPRAARAYKDINLWAMKMLAPGGRLMTFSCSGAVHPELFQKIVAGAAADARVDLIIEQRLSGSADHPVSIHFPEGEYLKGLLLRRK